MVLRVSWADYSHTHPFAACYEMDNNYMKYHRACLDFRGEMQDGSLILLDIDWTVSVASTTAVPFENGVWVCEPYPPGCRWKAWKQGQVWAPCASYRICRIGSFNLQPSYQRLFVLCGNEPWYICFARLTSTWNFSTSSRARSDEASRRALSKTQGWWPACWLCRSPEAKLHKSPPKSPLAASWLANPSQQFYLAILTAMIMLSFWLVTP